MKRTCLSCLTMKKVISFHMIPCDSEKGFERGSLPRSSKMTSRPGALKKRWEHSQELHIQNNLQSGVLLILLKGGLCKGKCQTTFRIVLTVDWSSSLINPQICLFLDFGTSKGQSFVLLSAGIISCWFWGEWKEN